MMENNTGAAKTGGGTGGFFLGLLTGVLVGGVAVMLYAPKSGPETRNLLKDELTRTQQMLQSWAEDIRMRSNELSQIIRFNTETQQPSGNGQKEPV